MNTALSIGAGAFLGALLRFGMGLSLNHFFPTLPFGTLFANLLGCGLMGGMMFLTMEHTFFSYEARLAIITGFLGSLTTFSTFAAEAFVLFSRQEFLWFAALLFLHVVGGICMVAIGYAAAKIVFNL